MEQTLHKDRGPEISDAPLSASAKTVFASTGERKELAEYKNGILEKTKRKLDSVAHPQTAGSEYDEYWSNCVEDIVNQIAFADDFSTADAIYNTASERIVELEKGLVSFERRKATARGKREPTSV